MEKTLPVVAAMRLHEIDDDTTPDSKAIVSGRQCTRSADTIVRTYSDEHIGLAATSATDATECQPANDSSDCCLTCFPLLSLFGYTSTTAWMRPDVEARCLKLLLSAMPDGPAQARLYLATPSSPGAAPPPLPECMTPHIDLLGLCYHTLQTCYSDAARRYVAPDRFLPPCPDAASGRTRHMAAACVQCCCVVLAGEGARSTLRYDLARSVAEDAAVYRRPRSADLADMLDAYVHSGDFVARLCRVVGVNSGNTMLEIVDEHFVSVDQYRYARLGLLTEAATRLALCGRRPGCLECLLSPAVAILDRCGAGTAFPMTHIAMHAVKASDDVLRTWQDPRCIHSVDTLRAGPDKCATALTWCFGGIDDARSTFMAVVQRLMQAGDCSTEDAVRFVHDIMLDNYELLHDHDRLSIGVRKDFIKFSLEHSEVYSYRTGLVVRSAAPAK